MVVTFYTFCIIIMVVCFYQATDSTQAASNRRTMLVGALVALVLLGISIFGQKLL